MPRILTYIKLGISREEVDEYPDWQQDLPQRTAAETASYFLGFLITTTGHIVDPWWAKCKTGTVKAHIDKVENEEE